MYSGDENLSADDDAFGPFAEDEDDGPRYVATVNVPGYLPMDDDPPVFDTAAEAWAYLESERERGEADTDDGTFVASECLTELRRIAEAAQLVSVHVPEVTTGTVYGDTPGYDGDHDLGLHYTVSIAED